MANSISMTDFLKKFSKNTLLIRASTLLMAVAFWLLIWQMAATLTDNSFILPDIPSTFSALLSIIASGKFFTTVLLTLLRVLCGLALGIVAGIVFAVFAYKSSIFRSLFSPIVSIIKSTPVASFIIILWISMSGDALAIFVAFLMVMPIIWQNLMDGFGSISNELLEVCEVFELSLLKKIRFLIAPALIKYLVPAMITATGLAWKSEIAAEIIAYTKNSIGYYINDAKYYLNTPEVFAWTFVIIVLSLLLERIAKSLLKRCKI